jgi:protein tyrosine phosphatase type 4A
MRFLIMDAPSDSNIDLYLRELKRYGVTDLVRVCDPTYARERVEEQGISVHEMLFPDGDAPSDSVVSAWMALVDSRFGHPTAGAGAGNSEETLNKDMATIAVHCVAGLGRAPALVAIALIEAGMSPLDAVAFLRERRRGAINNKQLCYLESYRRRSRSDKCLLM